MTAELLYVLLVIGAMLVLFATEKLRMDVVALLALLAWRCRGC